MAAFEQLLEMLRIMGGEGMIMKTLQEAREAYWAGRKADGLAEMLKSIVISEGVSGERMRVLSLRRGGGKKPMRRIGTRVADSFFISSPESVAF